jgi:hypothetical protein
LPFSPSRCGSSGVFPDLNRTLLRYPVNHAWQAINIRHGIGLSLPHRQPLPPEVERDDAHTLQALKLPPEGILPLKNGLIEYSVPGTLKNTTQRYNLSISSTYLPLFQCSPTPRESICPRIPLSLKDVFARSRRTIRKAP